MRVVYLRAMVLGLATVAGCGPEAATPSSFVTEHLEAEPLDSQVSQVVCRGTLDNMEAQVVRVAEILHVGLPSIIHVDWGPAAVEECCGNYGGCAGGLGDKGSCRRRQLLCYHELVHAVRRINGARGMRFFEEGLAQVLSGFRPFPIIFSGSTETSSSPAMLATIPSDQFTFDDYPVAGHFMSWLFTTYGGDGVAAFLNDAKSMEAETLAAAFEDHFGLSLEAAEDPWRMAPAEYHVWGETCDPAAELDWNGTVLEFHGRLDCDEPRVLGPNSGAILTRGNCFDLEQPGTVRLELIADSGEATLTNVECHSSGLPSEHYQTKRVVAGEALEVPFAGCVWEILVEGEFTASTDFTVRLTRL